MLQMQMYIQLIKGVLNLYSVVETRNSKFDRLADSHTRASVEDSTCRFSGTFACTGFLKLSMRGFMVSDDTMNIQVKVFHSPSYSKHLSLRLGPAAFNTTKDTTCITKNYPLI